MTTYDGWSITELNSELLTLKDTYNHPQYLILKQYIEDNYTNYTNIIQSCPPKILAQARDYLLMELQHSDEFIHNHLDLLEPHVYIDPHLDFELNTEAINYATQGAAEYEQLSDLDFTKRLVAHIMKINHD